MRGIYLCNNNFLRVANYMILKNWKLFHGQYQLLCVDGCYEVHLGAINLLKALISDKKNHQL